ncbi:MAG TPA: hypothetical protein PK867_23810 [Pirellulales bacterium]|nr:hypothetical protein [Pirellulales bacterium]
METRCAHCGQDCWVDDERSGKDVAGPACDRVFTANEPAEPPTALGNNFYQPSVSVLLPLR